MLAFKLGDYYFEYLRKKDLHTYLYINGIQTNYLIPRSLQDYSKEYLYMMQPDTFLKHYDKVLLLTEYGEELIYFKDLLHNLKKKLFPEYLI